MYHIWPKTNLTWHVFCGPHRPLPPNPFPSHLITVCQPLTRVGGYRLLNHKQYLPKDQVDCLQTFPPLSYPRSTSQDLPQHCNRTPATAFPPYCALLLWIPQIICQWPLSHFPSKHSPVNTPTMQVKKAGNTQPTYSGNPEKKQKIKNKTSTHKHKTRNQQ